MANLARQLFSKNVPCLSLLAKSIIKESVTSSKMNANIFEKELRKISDSSYRANSFAKSKSVRSHGFNKRGSRLESSRSGSTKSPKLKNLASMRHNSNISFTLWIFATATVKDSKVSKTDGADPRYLTLKVVSDKLHNSTATDFPVLGLHELRSVLTLVMESARTKNESGTFSVLESKSKIR